MESRLMPMLCGKADVVPEGDDWIAEPKLDGWRAIAHVTEDGTVQLFCGRNGAEYTGKLPYIEESLAATLTPGTVVDGELIGGEWGDVQGVMTRGNGPHVPSTAIPALTYVLFDMTHEGEDDLREFAWHARRDTLERYVTGAYRSDPPPPHIQLAPVGESTPETLAKMLDLGMEGIVCKRVDGKYVNKRANYWIKVKPQDTEDATLIGFYEAEQGSKYDGNSVGGICFKLANGYEGRAAGMDDPLRKEMFDYPERFIGRTVELKHHGMFSSGALRHPNFLRFRDDKDPPRKAPKKAPSVNTKASKRNYGAMKEPKLRKVLAGLKAGDATDVAKAGGPENVERDIAIVEQLLAEL